MHPLCLPKYASLSKQAGSHSFINQFTTNWNFSNIKFFKVNAKFSQQILQLQIGSLLGFTDDKKAEKDRELSTYMVGKQDRARVVLHMKHSHHQRISKT